MSHPPGVDGHPRTQPFRSSDVLGDLACSDSGNGALTGTCLPLKLKVVLRMVEEGSHVETAWLSAEDESVARLLCYIAVQDAHEL